MRSIEIGLAALLFSASTTSTAQQPAVASASSILREYGTELRTIEFEANEGTAMNVDVSPDGEEIVFDLLGDIYTLPITGGRAKLLIGGRSWDTEPRYSPDGTRIVFVSDRGDGPDALWLADREGKSARLLMPARPGIRLTSPVWSSDGNEIALRWGLRGIGIVDAHSGKMELLTTTGADTSKNTRALIDGADYSYAPSFSRDGRYVYLNQNAIEYPIGRIVRIDRQTNERIVLTTDCDITEFVHEHRPVVSRTGRWLAYVRYDAERKSTLRLRAISGGEDRALLSLPDGDDPYRWADEEGPRQNFAFTPDDSAIVLSLNGKLWRAPLTGGPPQAIPFRATVSQRVIPPVQPTARSIDDGPMGIRAIRAPTISRNARTLVFTAVGKLWIQDLESGRTRRLTRSTDLEYNPSISPDGRCIAYLSFRDLDQRRSDIDARTVSVSRVVWLCLNDARDTPVADSALHVLTVTPGDYGPPVWFPDGARILFTRADSTQATRFQDVFVWTDTSGSVPVAIGTANLHTQAYGRVARVNNRRSYRVNSDGSRIYFFESGQASGSVSGRTTDIVSILIDGSDRRVHLRLTEEFAVGAVAPNGRHAVVSQYAGGGTYLIPVPGVAASAELVSLSGSGGRRITRKPAASAFWLDDSTAFHAIGQTISRTHVRTLGNSTFHTVDLSLPQGRSTRTFAVRGARILTMAGSAGRERTIERGTIVVKNGRITAVNEMNNVPIPAGVMVIEGTSLTIIPGLIDVHAHIGVSLMPRPSLDIDDISYLAYGVTSRYDPSTLSAEADLEHYERIATGLTPGPRYYYSGPTFSFYNHPATSLDAARRMSALPEAFGVAVIKEFLQPARSQRQYLAQAADEAGMGITGHVGGLKEMLTRVADGFTAVEHSSFIGPIFRDVATFIARSGVNFTPNIIQNGGIDVRPQGFGFFFREMLRDSPPDTLKYFRFRWPEYFRERLGYVREPQRFSFDQLRLERLSTGAAAVIREGGMVSIGAHNPPGLFTHWEMWIIQRGGASPMEVLRAGTINGAKKIGIDRDVGSLEPGKLADFVVLTGNPLDDIRNTTKIRYVVADAVIFDGETMTRLWPSYQPLPRMGWQSRDEYDNLHHAGSLAVCLRDKDAGRSVMETVGC